MSEVPLVGFVIELLFAEITMLVAEIVGDWDH